MTRRELFELVGSDERPIRGEMYVGSGGASRPGIVLCHGFKGFARWGFFPHLAEQLAQAGFNAITFDFTGSGVGSDRERFTETEAFFANSYRKELDDLGIVVAEATHRGWLGASYGLFGFSRGGGIAILGTARDPRVGALVTWSSISTILRWSSDEVDAWRRRGWRDVSNARTGEVLRQGTAVLDEADRMRQLDLDIFGVAGHLTRPWLIVHGTADETVGVHEGRQLHTASGNRAELALVEGAGHTYKIKHPMSEPSRELDSATERTVRFFRANLMPFPASVT